MTELLIAAACVVVGIAIYLAMQPRARMSPLPLIKGES